ncbi:MAG: AbgT family transporter [Phycisphaerales bacterium]
MSTTTHSDQLGTTPPPEKPSGFLGFVERVGNALPDPATLFLGGAILVMVFSWIGSSAGWSVQYEAYDPVTTPVIDSGTGEPVVAREMFNEGRVNKVRVDENGDPLLVTITEPGYTYIDQETGDGQTKRLAVLETEQVMKTVTPNNLFAPAALYTIFKDMVTVFTSFHPLGIVLVAMLGIGVAEKTNCMAALLKALMLVTPASLLTPVTVFVGVLSSMAADAGYVVLPPLAAALYKALGRSPLVGLAAVFAGVSAGFSANLFPTSLDPLLSGLTQAGATILDPSYTVNPLCNYYFMIVSTFLLTGVGWAVTHFVVEPRLEKKPAELGGPSPLTDEDRSATVMTDTDKKGLLWAALWTLAGLAGFLALVLIPGAPFHGNEGDTPRWTAVIVPVMFVLFLLPGIAFGVATKSLYEETGQRKTDVAIATLMGRTMADMGPYIVLAFFAAQFIALFNQSNLGLMLAIVGGNALAGADMPSWLLVSVFIIVVMFGNLFIGSASAKFAIFAPVFVPMFMRVGISPELVQAAYRVGDSSSNIIAPLMPYLIVLLVFMRKYVPSAGIGTIISLMLPYSIAFWIVWTIMLIVWMLLGVPLGIEGPLTVPVAS